MSTPRLILLFKTILPVRSAGYFLVTLLVLVLVPHSALARNGKKITATLTVGQPTADGELLVKVVATVDGTKHTLPTDNKFKADITPAQLARIIFRTLAGEIACKKLEDVVKVGINKNVVTVEFDPDSVSISVPSNTTGAEINLTITSDGTNLFWSLYRWPFASNAVVPAGTVMTMTAIEPNGTTLAVSVTGDGVLTVNQLQQQVTDQFSALGVNFTTIVNPRNGKIRLVSQLFAGTGGQVGQVQWNADWANYLGGAGVANDSEVGLKPFTLAFGTVPQGTTKNRSITVTNNGPLPLSFNGIPTVTGTNSNLFTVLPYSSSPATSTCLNGSVTLNQGESCTFTVQFASPIGTVTTDTVYLNIDDNGGFSPQLKKMTATN
jgi:hypothetical protein